MQRFVEWQISMWKLLEQHMIEKELASRPKYFKMWAEAKEKHMGPFFLEFHSRVQKE